MELNKRVTESSSLTFMESAVHLYTLLTLPLMTRIRITGRENIPTSGPLLVVANHLSTMDPPLLSYVLPATTRFVGPGDFKLLFPADLFVKWSRIIPVKRSLEFGRAPLKAMTDVLKGGGYLMIFPEGGTWEKPITDAKSGPAYLSLVTGSPILPIGLGGTYQSWNQVARLKRPILNVNIGEVMPPIRVANRSERAEALEAATSMIMQRIYDLLPAQDKAWYDRMAKRRFDVRVQRWRGTATELVDLPGRAVLGEIMQKPNLMSPLVRNARLPLDPLRYPGVRFTPKAVNLAAGSLHEKLTGDFSGYMEYRLGQQKTGHLFAALNALVALSEDPETDGISFQPSYIDG